MERKLINLRKQGYSAGLIAEQLAAEFDNRVTRNSVISKMRRMELPVDRPPIRQRNKNTFWTEDREEQLKKYMADGMTYTDIGYQMCKDRNTIAAKCKQLGIESVYKNFDSKLINKLNRIERKKVSWAENAKARAEWKKQVYKNIQRKKAGIVYPPIITYETDKFGILRNPKARRVSLMDLKANWCHFTSGDPKTPEFVYCGADVSVGSEKPYCDVCRKIMYVPSKYSTSIEKKYR